MSTLFPDPVQLTVQGAVELSRVDLFPLNKCFFFNKFPEFIRGDKMVLTAVHFALSGMTGSGRYAEGQSQFLPHQMLDYGGLAGSGRCTEND